MNFWRDKQQREVGCVLWRGRGACDAIECKWRAAAFDPKGLVTFRSSYPQGINVVGTPDAREAYDRQTDALDVRFTNLTDLPRNLEV